MLCFEAHSRKPVSFWISAASLLSESTPGARWHKPSGLPGSLLPLWPWDSPTGLRGNRCLLCSPVLLFSIELWENRFVGPRPFLFSKRRQTRLQKWAWKSRHFSNLAGQPGCWGWALWVSLYHSCLAGPARTPGQSWTWGYGRRVSRPKPQRQDGGGRA